MNRFVVGFVVGAAVGATVVAFVAPDANGRPRYTLPGSLGSAQHQLSGHIRAALDSGRHAASSAEQMMWDDFRKRLKNSSDGGDTQY
jgi:gas vesicle protein